MKKLLFLIYSMMTATPLLVAHQAVVFDWGNVIGFDDRSIVVDFMCDSFHFSESEFETVNLEKRKAIKEGKSDIDFWLDLAQTKGVHLPQDWAQRYTATLKKSVGTDSNMYMLIQELKENGMHIGMLSNIDDRYTKLIRDFGFYEPFEPCLLSCEMGLQKPDPQAFELLLMTMNPPAEEIVFIDDNRENVEAAKKLGIDSVIFEI